MSKYIDADLLVEMQIYDDEHEEWLWWKGTIEELLDQWTEQGCPPIIEVSEDCISREDAIKAYNEAIDELVKAEMEEFNLGDFTECSFNTTQLKLIARKIENAPSVVPRLDKEDLEDVKEHIAESYVEGYMDGHAKCVEQSTTTEEWKWESDDICDNCGYKIPHIEKVMGDVVLMDSKDWQYCPNCGAKMKV